MSTEEFDERLRIQSLLYPWISLSVINGRFSTFQSESLKATGIPKGTVSVILEELSVAVCWSTQDNAVSIRKITECSHDGIALSFRNSRDAVSFFEDGKLSSAVFLKKLKVLDWSRFLLSLLSVQKLLGNAGWDRMTDSKLYDKTRLTLYSAIVGLNGLGEIDGFSGNLMDHLPNGILRVRIGGIKEDVCAVEIRKGRLIWHHNMPDSDLKTVDFEFKDVKSAWKCVANLSDNLAAVGKGDIKLRGFIPLADGFNHMLDRLQMYVTA